MDFVFKCKMCGAPIDTNESMTIGTCPYCGTKTTLPKLNNDKRANMYERAGYFRRNNEYERAMGIYEAILAEDRTDAEAYWSLLLCRYGVEYVEDKASGRRIPTCNRTQPTSILNDTDFKMALKYAEDGARELYATEAHVIDGIQQRILKAAASEKPYDVFICYKESDGGKRTEDSYQAQNLYTFLVQNGYRVFFARESLRDKVSENYEPYIYNALNTAKVMIVYGSKAEYITSVWTENEWERFADKQKQGEKHPSALVVACEGVSPYALPDVLSQKQCMDAVAKTFYIDLLAHIKKVMATAPAAAKVQAPAASTQGAAVSTSSPAKSSAKKKKTKKITVLVSIIAIIVGLAIAFGVLYANGDLGGGSGGNTAKFKVEDVSGGCMITGLNNSLEADGALVIPVQIDGKNVVAIKESCFYADSSIKSLSFEENSVCTTIGTSSFYGCQSLTSIDLGPVTTVGEHAFENCTALKTANLPNVISLGEGSSNVGAFCGCTSLESISAARLPALVGSTLDELTALKTVSIPSVESLSQDEFYGLSKLESIDISSVEIVGSNAFYGCTSLKTINLPECLTISSGAFFGCSSLDSVSMPKVVTIGDSAFADTGLRSLNLPVSALMVDFSKFPCAVYTTAATAYMNWTDTSECVIYYGVSDSNLVEKDGVTYYYNASDGSVTATASKASLTAVDLSQNVNFDGTERAITAIGANAFSKTSLQSVTIPAAITSIGKNAFLDCKALATINYNAANATVGEKPFFGCGTETTGGITLNVGTTATTIAAGLFRSDYNDGCALTHVTFEEGSICETIGEYAFIYCHRLTEFTAPASLRTVDDLAFYNSGLTSVTLNDGLTEIGASAFSNCYSLTYVIVPATVLSMGEYAFYRNTLGTTTLYISGFTSAPSGWDSTALSVVYWADEWTMVGDVPTPNE